MEDSAFREKLLTLLGTTQKFKIVMVREHGKGEYYHWKTVTHISERFTTPEKALTNYLDATATVAYHLFYPVNQ